MQRVPELSDARMRHTAVPGWTRAERQRSGAGGAYGVEVPLPFKGKQESEADEIGLRLMAQAGYDPREAVPFWERMSGCPRQMIDKVCFRSKQKVPEFLSTHPSDLTRINQIEAWLPEAMKHYHGSGGGMAPLYRRHIARRLGRCRTSADSKRVTMPRRTDIQSILLIGSGPIVIGQACEFDYSGTQACKALKEEGYRVILINSNPATIMTDPEMADRTYVEPITVEVVEKVIERERPDALLPTMGGQTALNTTMGLVKRGTLEKYKVTLIGASAEAIHKAEDREAFKQAMQRIGLRVPTSGTAHTREDAIKILEQSDFRRSSGRPLPWAEPVETSRTTGMNSRADRLGVGYESGQPGAD